MRLLGLGLLLVLAAVLGLVSGVVLALGSLFSHLFAVTTFEASLIVLGSAIVMGIWLGLASPTAADPAPDLDDEEPPIILQALSVPMPRSARRRKRQKATPSQPSRGGVDA